MNYLQKKLRILKKSIKQCGDNLPQGYKKIDWIKANGNECIITEINSTRDTVVKCEIELTKISNEQECIFGNSYNSSTGRPSFVLLIQNNKFQGVVCNNKWYDTKKEAEIGIKYKIQASYKKYVINDIVFNIDDDENWNDKIVQIGIFTRYTPNLENPYLHKAKNVKLYNFEILKSGRQVFNGIPCLDNNNRPCMFDTVTKQTFYNQGTGEFLYGEVIN